MFKVVTQSPNIPALEYTADASVAFHTGYVGYRDISSGEIKEASSSTGTTLNIECVIAKTKTTAASNPTIRAIPILNGSIQLWIADCTSNTAANQLNKAHGLTNAYTVANTSTAIETTLGIFIALKIIGATTDKKLLGYFVKVGQKTA